MSTSIWAGSLDALYDFIMYVVVHAPDRFPKRDFLKADQQLNLEKAFAELNGAMRLVRKQIADAAIVTRLQQILDSSYAEYEAGNMVKGAHLLQDFRRLAFPDRS